MAVDEITVVPGRHVTARGLSLRYLQTLQTMILSAEDHGLSKAEIFDGSNVDPAALENPHATLTRSQELTICRNIAACSDCPDIGLIAGYRQRPQVSGALGYAQSACSTVDEVVMVTRAYQQLGLSLMRWDVIYTETELIHRFTSEENLGDVRIFVIEHLLATFLRGTRELVLETAAPTLVKLDYPDPGYGRAYVEIFGPHVAFDQPTVELRFPIVIRHTPMRTPDPLVRSKMEHLCQSLVSKLNSQLILAEEVKNMLRATEFGTPGIGDIAARLYVSSRSLHRHLSKQSTNFRALVDEVNHERAVHYLTNTEETIQAISDRCGFVELRSFYSAFRRWTGMSPANYSKGKFNY
jgi:AraC-like DNA-binding protein